MPISVTCECSAKLEIDEKFLGKQVLCPDCQRPLPTAPPTRPPPLEIPDYKRVSGLAVLSLSLALVFAFTIIGTIAAIAVGLLALREIGAKAGKLEGGNLARAAIALGAAFTFITLAGFISPYIFGVDQFMRDLALASRLDYMIPDTIKDVPGGRVDLEITRPSKQWAKYQSGAQQTVKFTVDDLILVDTHDDAYISVQGFEKNIEDRNEDMEKNALARLQKSEVIALMARGGYVPTLEELKTEKSELGADGVQEMIVDARVGGIERRFLIFYRTQDPLRINVLVCAARKNRFAGLEATFREVFSGFKAKL